MAPRLASGAAVLALVLAACSPRDALAQPRWMGVNFVTGIDSDAVCNDGSEAGRVTFNLFEPPAH